MSEYGVNLLKLPIGNEFFEKIREVGSYYVDKTGFIPELLFGDTAVTLLTRPRRFGKTLTMTMLQSFFDIQRDSKKYFEGLNISKYPEVCAQWMNQFPTIFVTLKGAEGITFEEAFERLKSIISDECKRNDYLEQSPDVQKDDLAKFRRLCSEEANKTEVTEALKTLSKMLAAHWKKPVILLIDEYDVPLAKAHVGGYYPEMVAVIRALMSDSLKTNTDLKKAFLTGCLRVSKESIFTGFNNPTVFSISDEKLSEFIGFSQAEVDQLLQAAHLPQCGKALKEWYDGYIFGNSEMYCPWDVMNHVDRLQTNPNVLPKSYWKNSSSNDILTQFFEKGASSDSKQKFETLLAGGSIQVQVAEELTYGSLTDSEDTFWSLLYLTGYLTKADTEPVNGQLYSLRIPNAEIKELFQQTIIDRFKKTIRTSNLSRLFEAFWKGDAATANEEVGKLLRTTISYYDNKEDFYHAFIVGIFAGAGYVVRSNREAGGGRPDVIVTDIDNEQALVIEIKHSANREQLSSDCNLALKQIKAKDYDHELLDDGYNTIHPYGIAFYKKTCLIKKDA